MKNELGRYSVLRHRRGDDSRVRGLSLRASGLLLRLMLCRSCTSFGAIVGGRAALAEETGVDAAEFSGAFADLEKAGLVLADWKARLVFVGFMAEDDPPVNKNMAIGRGRMLGDLPACDLRRAISATCLKFAGPWADDLENAAVNFGTLDADEFDGADEVRKGLPS